MAFVVEDGTGIVNANANTTVEFAEAYLTDRNRLDENDWIGQPVNVKQSAIISATDFIEQQFGQRFKGIKEFRNFTQARATLTLSAQPLDTETVTIGTQTYTFNTVLGGADSVLIGASVADTIVNLVAAVAALSSLEGVSFGVGTTANVDAVASSSIENTMLAQAVLVGTPGNTIASTTTVTGATWSSATLIGGKDAKNSQPLSFPRLHLYDRDGSLVLGMPDKVMFATVEYAIRALDNPLSPDPEWDDTGRPLKRMLERVGPIWQDREWEGGSALTQKAYPAAERWLIDYLVPSGRVIR